ncbi:hypothetical protein N7508_004261 [Penicillium antarcticum]|uniref:uncharacterized protein n=1 Tax=Penicillium antarcticum TaxID=416450 RepID=UPI0023A49FC6|nr:uncharacterized protein N7508_004261 [Penicillium antarcticum]KAJ5308882.1 hypothetical protein N7508_004261 [Penicillium antarcticum]
MKLSTLLGFAGLGAALPSLGSIKKFELNLTWDTRAPDGVEREQALVNGQFPGPPLLMDEGDTVEVTVNNYLHYNTTIHYHGLECTDSLLINGRGRVRCVSPGYASSLIPPTMLSLLQGKNYTVKGCLALDNTYAQTTYAPHNLSAVPSTLYNECNATEAEEAVIDVESWKGWASLNFIGSASISVPTVSINNHSMWVYEVDGQYIQPALTVNNGGRYSALVKLNNTAGDYPIIVANSGLNQKLAGRATLSYANGDPNIGSTPSINYGGNSLTSDVVVLDESTIKPLVSNKPSQRVDETYVLDIGRYEKAWRWSLNSNNAYNLALEAERPMLWDPKSYENSSLVIATKNNTWVDIIFKVVGDSTTLQPGHPLHKHSNPVYVLGSGTGEFNYTSVAEAAKEMPGMFNLVNPPMRDTFTSPAAFQGQAWMAIRYHVINPGAFFMHCHIDPHLTGGMALAMLDGVDVWPTVPAQYGPKGHWGNAA